MKRKYSKKPSEFREIALERIKVLFEQAQLRFKEHPELSNRYAKLARTIAMKYKVRIPSELKRRYCSHCYHFLMPGVNSRVRIQKGRVIIYCGRSEERRVGK